jgi:GGDEF domain-containing protein
LLEEETDCHRDFIGHIGGDDFLVIFRSDDWQRRCTEILRRFDEEVIAFYDQKDLEQGGIWSEARDGSRKFFPLISLSIGAVHSGNGAFTSCHAISSAAVEMKHQAKKVSGSHLFVDRRQHAFSAENEVFQDGVSRPATDEPAESPSFSGVPFDFPIDGP